MRPPEETASAPSQNRALPLLLVAASLALGWILVPFYGTILWACIIALIFAPVNHWLLSQFNRRRSLAALSTLLIAVVVVIVPFTILSAALAREALLVYERLQSGESNPVLYLHRLFDALPIPMRQLLERLGVASFDGLQRRLTAALTQGSQLIATRAFGVGQNAFEFVADLFITTYIAFFLIRDGESLVRAARRAIPLEPRYKTELVDKFATVIRATVKGNLLVAAVQGALGGLAFWFLGVNAALLWGVLMAFLSLLPAIGAALVWLPVAIYLFFIGSVWQSIALMAFGLLVIGLIDNLLRPILVGRDTRMPDYVVMITTLGGFAVFGLNGFVLGPTIAAMFIAVWHIHAVARPDAHQ